MNPPAHCPACGVAWPTNGHSIGGALCLQRQLGAVRGAVREYLAAQAALSAAGVTPERPAAARRMADAWIALNKAAPAEVPLVPR